MKFQESDSESLLSEINIIPFVDIVLVLLIIFMVAAPMLQQGVDIQLPEVSAGNVNSNQEDFILSVNNQGEIFLGQDKNISYNTNNLEEKLTAIFNQKEKKELYLRADSGLDYGKVVEIMAICQKSGVESIGMITDPSSK
jgi:biopolymer transport protein TolR